MAEESGTTKDALAELLAQYSPNVRDLALKLRVLMRQLIPDAVEEIDPKARLFGYTFQPGTYAGLILAIAPQRSYVNIILSKGVELMPLDSTELLEGTGKLARHIKVGTEERLNDPTVQTLIKEAAARTPR